MKNEVDEMKKHLSADATYEHLTRTCQGGGILGDFLSLMELDEVRQDSAAV
jgi:hypothetical protein